MTFTLHMDGRTTLNTLYYFNEKNGFMLTREKGNALGLASKKSQKKSD